MEYLSYKIDQINNVNEYEYALILAKIEEVMDEKKMFNCYHCKAKNKNKERTIKGCFDAVVRHKLENIVYKYCLGNYCLPSTSELLSLFTKFEKGMLPNAGGLLDQVAKTMQIFDIIETRREEKRSGNKENEQVTETQRRVNAKLKAKRLKDGQRSKS